VECLPVSPCVAILAKASEKVTSIHIAKVQQAKGEDLKEYVVRFNREAIWIPDSQDGVAYAAYLNGLLPGRFKFLVVESKVIENGSKFDPSNWNMRWKWFHLARCLEKSRRRRWLAVKQVPKEGQGDAWMT